ncbi:hypothetical protein BsWGS_21867 [Bradybaena similaris]
MASSRLEMTQKPLLTASLATDGGQCSPRRWWHRRCCRPVLAWLDNPEKKRKALVQKNGSYRVHTCGLRAHLSKFLADMYITVIDLEWRYLFFSLFASFFGTFMFFAFFWWLMGYTNGDFDMDIIDKPDHEFCLRGVKSFAGVIMFSMETQTTIGYGVAAPNPHCAATVPLLFIQVLMGLFLETFMLGAIFVKIARPKYRANTILFSRHAVVNQENGKLVLQVRVGDVRQSHLIGASITGMVIRGYAPDEGVYYPLYQHNCAFTANKMADRMCLLWPVIITHVIDQDSPLYDVGPSDTETEKNFEVILYLSGSVESIGETCQARTSYVGSEILWGHRFKEIEELDLVNRQWRINFSGFNTTACGKAILHSAKQLDEIPTKLPKDKGL